jgi:hypothetical protein
MVDDSEFPMVEFQVAGYFTQEVAVGLLSRAERAPWKLFTLTPTQAAAALPGAQPGAGLPGTTAAPGSSAQMSASEVSQEVSRVEPPHSPQPPLQPPQGDHIQTTPPTGVTGMEDILKSW